jgi:hypothetical protein
MANIDLPAKGEANWDTKLNAALNGLNGRLNTVETATVTAPVTSVNTKTGDVTLTQDDVNDGTTYKRYSVTEKTKLAAIAAGATANSTDATLLSRANHTGTQSADTITDGTTNKAYTAAEKTKLAGLATVATSGSYADLTNKPTIPAAYTDTQATAAVKNALAAGTNITFSTTGDVVTINNVGGYSGQDTLFGWSGSSIPGIDADIIGTWMARDSWTGMASAQWLSANSGYMSWIAAHPYRAADLGIPLIPHDSVSTTTGWNSLLDEVIAGTRDSTFTSMGTALASNSPRTVYARIFWEMNMSPKFNGVDRSKFIAAWNRAVPLIKAAFLTAAPNKNFYIVFSALSDGSDFTAWYPGDTNVDVIAPDVYATIYGSTTPSASALLASVKGYLDTYAAFAKAHKKRVGLGEWGNWELVAANGNTGSRGLGDFPEYIDMVIDWARANNAEYLSYYNLTTNTNIDLSSMPNSTARLVARFGSVGAVRSGVNAQTGVAYTLTSTDSTTLTTTLNNASAITVTVPPNASVPFPIGTYIEMIQLGVGLVTVTGASGVTVTPRGGATYVKTAGQGAMIGLRKVDTDTWILGGDLSS